MDNEKIKEILLDIAPTELEFTVTQTGRQSGRVNGLYKPDTHEILLHNKNFKTDNQLIYTAVHEYTHHLNAEELIKTTGNPSAPYNAKVHTQAFWAKFNGLIDTAEKKGYYSIGFENSPELQKLTEEIRKNYVEQNGRLMQEFGRLLAKAYELCEQANIRYEDYIERVLCIPKSVERNIRKVGAVPVDPSIGFDNMKTVAGIRSPEKRAEIEKLFQDGAGPVSVRQTMRQSAAKQEEPRQKLEREKSRLEKTIGQLSKRLEFVEEALANL